jgi:hypothetical protein
VSLRGRRPSCTERRTESLPDKMQVTPGAGCHRARSGRRSFLGVGHALSITSCLTILGFPLAAAAYPVQNGPTRRITRGGHVMPSLTKTADSRTGVARGWGEDRKTTDVDRPGLKVVATQGNAFLRLDRARRRSCLRDQRPARRLLRSHVPYRPRGDRRTDSQGRAQGRPRHCRRNLLTWYIGIPSSSSHALVGGLVVPSHGRSLRSARGSS